MRELLDRLQVRFTGMRATAPNRRPSPTFEVTTKLTGAERPPTLKEYAMRLSLEATFWANDYDGMYEVARQKAERLLLTLLYEDMIATFAALDAALASRDIEAAEELVFRLRTKVAL